MRRREAVGWVEPLRGSNKLSSGVGYRERARPNLRSAHMLDQPDEPPQPHATRARARFPGPSRGARGGRAAGARRPADQQGHRAPSARALAVPGRARRGSAAPSCSPMSSTAAGGNTTCRSWSARWRLRRRSMRSAWAAARRDRRRMAQGDRASDPAGHGGVAAVPGGRDHRRRSAQARRRPQGACPCRSRRRASTPRPISPRRSASRRIPRPACGTWAPIAAR